MPCHAHATLSIVTTAHSRPQNGVLRTPMPVVHAEFEQANARWEALCKRKFCTDCRIKSGNDEAVLIMLYASISSAFAASSFAAATISNIFAP
jgi:hypothetical protein